MRCRILLPGFMSPRARATELRRLRALLVRLLVLVVTTAPLAAPAFLMGPRAAHAAPPALRFSSDFDWFGTGRFPQGLVSADFNHDGLPDLATADSLDDGVSVFLALPGGTFAPRRSFGAGEGPSGLVAVDVNGDGRVDLVVADHDASTLFLLLGQGDGTFREMGSISVPGPPVALLATDLTGNGHVDLVVLVDPVSGGGTWLLEGDGAGGFGAPQAVMPGLVPVAVAGPELRAHGKRALALVGFDGTVTVVSRSTGGRFQLESTLNVPACPRALLAGDLDGDGNADLVLAGCASALPDTTGTGAVYLLRGKGNGRFDRHGQVATSFIASAMTLVDVDMDGKPDVAALDVRGLAVLTLPGRGDGSFGNAVRIDTQVGVADLWAGDLDGDGNADLAITSWFTDRMAILRGDGHGGFAAQSDANSQMLLPNPYLVQGARLRAGGPMDLVVAHALHDGFVSIGRNAGNGTFSFADSDTVHTHGQPSALAVGDVNGDGLPDIVVGNSETDTVDVFLADPADTLRPVASFPAGGRGPVSVALGDVDGDGRTDLVVANSDSRTLVLFQGAGNGQFTPVQTLLAGAVPMAVALAHIDGDAALDLVTAQDDRYPARGLVAVYRGDGTGRFGAFDPAFSARVGYQPRAIVARDLDGDGVPDVAVANQGSSTVTVFPVRRGAPAIFGPALTLGSSSAAGALAAADVTGDGRLDLLVAGLAAPGVTVLVNRTDSAPGPTVAPGIDVAPGQCPNRLNVDAGGTLQVALLGGSNVPGFGPLDVAAVPADSVTLEGVAAEKGVALRDVSGSADAAGGDGCGCSGGGRGRDGVADALFSFDARALAAALGDVQDGDTRVLHFTARLSGGRRFDAQDCVQVTAHGHSGGGHGRHLAGGVRPGLTGPNPLARGTATSYVYLVPAGGATVRIGVYTVAGRRVATLVDAFADPGAHEARWDGRDETGRTAPPGVYFVRASVGGAAQVSRLVIAP